MVQAGAKPIDWLAVISEWAPTTHRRNAPCLAMFGRAEAASSTWRATMCGAGHRRPCAYAELAAPGQARRAGRRTPTRSTASRRRCCPPSETKDSAKVKTAYYAPGAVIATPGRPGERTHGLDQAIKDDLADHQLKITGLAREDRGSPARVTWATAAARSKSRRRIRTDQTGGAERGHYLAVFRKQADGSWKIAEDFGV